MITLLCISKSFVSGSCTPHVGLRMVVFHLSWIVLCQKSLESFLYAVFPLSGILPLICMEIIVCLTTDEIEHILA